MKLTYFDVSFRTAYAQAKDLALAQENVPLLTAGTVQTEDRGNSRFVYRYRYDANGKRVTEYLGPEAAEETAARLAQATDEISEANAISKYSKDLRRVGFHSTDNSTLITVAALFNAGIFSHGGLLIGTHAFGAILNELGVAASRVALTQDVDLARLTRIEIAALPKGGFLKLLLTTGLPFLPVPALDRGEPPTSFKVRGKRLKVDLLVPARGEPYEPVEVPELGAHATGLPHLRYLLEEKLSSVLLGRDRIVPVSVPHPGRFCVHKLAVYSMRSGGAKSEKDLEQATVLAAVLAGEQNYLLTDAIDATGKSLRSRARAGARRAVEMLDSEYPEAAQLLSTLA